MEGAGGREGKIGASEDEGKHDEQAWEASVRKRLGGRGKEERATTCVHEVGNQGRNMTRPAIERG